MNAAEYLRNLERAMHRARQFVAQSDDKREAVMYVVRSCAPAFAEVGVSYSDAANFLWRELVILPLMSHQYKVDISGIKDIARPLCEMMEK